MSDKLPGWRPIHSHGIRSGDLVFYSHKVSFEVMSQNKRNIAHVDLPSARAAHEAALSKGNKEPWTRTRFTIGE